MKRLLPLLLLATLPAAAPAAAQNGGGNIVTPVNVKVLKPLQISRLRDLDFGTIAMRPFTGTQLVSVSPAGRTCGSGGLLTCTGLFTTAQFRIIGTNRETVLIRSVTPTVTLRNGTGGTLTMTPALPATVTLPNSGNQGVIIDVGGQLQIPANAAGGFYTGILEVRVDYQ